MAHPEIRLLVLDVDGVLTDGTILFDEDGRQLRRFHIRDGLGITMWRVVGRTAAILTSKRSPLPDTTEAPCSTPSIVTRANDVPAFRSQ